MHSSSFMIGWARRRDETHKKERLLGTLFSSLLLLFLCSSSSARAVSSSLLISPPHLRYRFSFLRVPVVDFDSHQTTFDFVSVMPPPSSTPQVQTQRKQVLCRQQTVTQVNHTHTHTRTHSEVFLFFPID